MILFVFEGERSEPRLFRTIEQLYFRGEDVILCSYGNDIYELYREMRSLGDGADIVAILKNKGKEGLEEVARVSDFPRYICFSTTTFMMSRFLFMNLIRGFKVC